MRLSYDLSTHDLRRQNLARAEKWHEGADPWSLADWANALAGEVGEACNVVKKIRRLETNCGRTRENERDRDLLLCELGNEIGDVMIYLDLLAHAAGVDLGWAVRAKFNSTSEAFGFDETIGKSDDEFDYCRSCDFRARRRAVMDAHVRAHHAGTHGELAAEFEASNSTGPHDRAPSGGDAES